MLRCPAAALRLRFRCSRISNTLRSAMFMVPRLAAEPPRWFGASRQARRSLPGILASLQASSRFVLLFALLGASLTGEAWADPILELPPVGRARLIRLETG